MKIYKHKLFVPSLFLILLSVSFKFDSESISWFWIEQPAVGGMLAITSLTMWVILFATRNKKSDDI